MRGTLEGRALALRIADHIDRFPEQYDQGNWGLPSDDDTHNFDVEGILAGGKCGTPACVAGWAIRLGAGESTPLNKSVQDAGAELLGLRWDVAHMLFGGGNCPVLMPGVLRYYAETGELKHRRDMLHDFDRNDKCVHCGYNG